MFCFGQTSECVPLSGSRNGKKVTLPLYSSAQLARKHAVNETPGINVIGGNVTYEDVEHVWVSGIIRAYRGGLQQRLPYQNKFYSLPRNSLLGTHRAEQLLISPPIIESGEHSLTTGAHRRSRNVCASPASRPCGDRRQLHDWSQTRKLPISAR